MRLFKRKAKKCENLSFVYNYLSPEDGVEIYLGVGKDELLPGLSKREIAYHHIAIEDIDGLIEQLQEIQNEFHRRGY